MLAILLLAASCSVRDASNARSVSGTIETDEALVASRYGGRVERVLTQEGDALTGGQVIVELEAAELRAKRDQAAASLAELEAGPRKEEIEAAKHDWEALVAELDQARVDAKRLCALLFLCREVLGLDLDDLSATARAKRGPRLPTVLSVPETAALLGTMRGTTWLMAALIYGAACA